MTPLRPAGYGGQALRSLGEGGQAPLRIPGWGVELERLADGGAVLRLGAGDAPLEIRFTAVQARVVGLFLAGVPAAQALANAGLPSFALRATEGRPSEAAPVAKEGSPALSAPPRETP